MRIKVSIHEGQPVRVKFKCPGCGSEHDLPVRADGAEASRPSWIFNGNVNLPTLQPSILAKTGPFPPDCNPAFIIGDGKPNSEGFLICHSFVANGQIQFLGDCTHKLANQTVDLPEIDNHDQAQ